MTGDEQVVCRSVLEGARKCQAREKKRQERTDGPLPPWTLGAALNDYYYGSLLDAPGNISDLYIKFSRVFRA